MSETLPLIRRIVTADRRKSVAFCITIDRDAATLLEAVSKDRLRS